jgi:hypothetical protein
MPGRVHVSGYTAGSDCVFYQKGKGKFDIKSTETSGGKPGKSQASDTVHWNRGRSLSSTSFAPRGVIRTRPFGCWNSSNRCA